MRHKLLHMPRPAIPDTSMRAHEGLPTGTLLIDRELFPTCPLIGAAAAAHQPAGRCGGVSAATGCGSASSSWLQPLFSAPVSSYKQQARMLVFSAYHQHYQLPPPVPPPAPLLPLPINLSSRPLAALLPPLQCPLLRVPSPSV